MLAQHGVTRQSQTGRKWGKSVRQREQQALEAGEGQGGRNWTRGREVAGEEVRRGPQPPGLCRESRLWFGFQEDNEPLESPWRATRRDGKGERGCKLPGVTS